MRTTVPDYQVDAESNWNSKYWQEFGSPAGGLFSTPEDYAVLCALMLGGGQRDEVRLLSPAAVRMMTSNRLNDLPDLPEPVRRTQPWGLGWRLNHLGTPDSWGDLLGRHVFGHTGSAGNVVWMDPETQGFCIVFANYLRARAVAARAPVQRGSRCLRLTLPQTLRSELFAGLLFRAKRGTFRFSEE